MLRENPIEINCHYHICPAAGTVCYVKGAVLPFTSSHCHCPSLWHGHTFSAETWIGPCKLNSPCHCNLNTQQRGQSIIRWVFLFCFVVLFGFFEYLCGSHRLHETSYLKTWHKKIMCIIYNIPIWHKLSTYVNDFRILTLYPCHPRM